MSVEFTFRLIGMVAFGLLGAWLGDSLSNVSNNPTELWITIFGLVGVLAGLILTPAITVRPVLYVNRVLRQASSRAVFSGVLGLVISLIITGLMSFPISMLPQPFSQVIPIIIVFPISYLGVSVFVSRQNDIFSIFQSLSPAAAEVSASMATHGRVILLDTSVVIDGRIADIARTGFLAGELLVPRFVLNELQLIADSGDTLRRQRGRRGLEVLGQMQKDPFVPIRISDMDVEGVQPVDDKLIILARKMKTPILTNDYNLNQVAELQGVTILNINELANAVKTVFLPGESINIRVIQEGREPGQGIGYLEDGTMVVVQNGNQVLNTEVEVTVTKVLQTAAGRMIFCRIVNE